MGLISIATALTLGAASASGQPPSVQQQFEAAAASLNAEKWDEALRTFEALEARMAKNPRSLAIVRLRKSQALVALQRLKEAEAALEAGLAALPKDDAGLTEDRLLATVMLAEVKQAALDYPAALRLFRAAEPLASAAPDRLRILRGLIKTGLFYDGAAALADTERALALIRAQPGDTKALHAQFRIMKGRTLMNLGRFEEARAELKAATDALGGLTLKVDGADMAARSDLAIAALLAGKEDEARKYMAYTGAGRLAVPLALAAEMEPPACGDEEGLRPDDVAVIEFSIGADGSVGYATPIYASRQGDVALAFARAASGWSWSAAQIKDVPAFHRAQTRVELRCTTSAKRPSVTRILDGDVDDWLEARGAVATRVPEGNSARRVKPLLEELAARRKDGKPVQTVPLLVELSTNATIPAEDSKAYLDEALAIARSEKAPPAVLAYFGLSAAQAEYWRKGYRARRTPNLTALLADPAIAADPRALAAVRLSEADNRYRIKGQEAQAIALLGQIRGAAGLDPNDPLYAAALVRLASLEYGRGNETAARSAFTQSGLDATQCALLDAQPRVRSGYPSDRDFPQDAMKWGFEGWANVEYDIAATGETGNVRATVAYPPFVFSSPTAKIVERLQYAPTFRPGSNLGCGGQQFRVRFVLP